MIRPIKIKHYLNRMAHRGFSSAQILDGAMINADKLDDPTYLIDIWQLQKVINNMIDLSGNEALGIEIGQEIKFSDFGIVGYALMASHSMRDVIQLWRSFSHSLVGVMLDIGLEEKAEEWRITFREVVPLGPRVLRFCVEENLTFGQWIGESVVKQDIYYSSVEFKYACPKNTDAYKKLFKGPLRFDAPVTAVNVTSPSIDAIAPDNSETELFMACQQYCHQVLRQVTAARPLAFQIRNLFLRSGGRIPSFDDVAEQLNASPRSLRRHLQAEGINYRELINEFRCDMAKEYIQSSCLTNQQIGYLLGYDEPKAFMRAFKGWCGMTISEYRTSISKSA